MAAVSGSITDPLPDPLRAKEDSKNMSLSMSFSSSLGSLNWLTRFGTPTEEAPAAAPVVPKVTEGAKRKHAATVVAESAKEPELDCNWSAPSDTKPPFAYNFVIYQAINACNKEKVTLGEVYSQIMQRYGYYRQRKDETGWKNSIRHNLTVHDCFVKVMRDKSKGENGKGGFWQVDEELAQHEVDFSQRGLIRTGSARRSKKKRKVAAKSRKSQKGETKAVGPVKLASDDEAVSPLPQSPMSAVSATSLVGAETSAEISADSSMPLLSDADIAGITMNSGAEEMLGMLDDTYNEADVLSSLKMEMESGVALDKQGPAVNTLGSSFANVYSGLAGSFTNLAGSFGNLGDSISGLFKW